MPKVIKNKIHVAGDYDISEKEAKLRARRQRVKDRIGGVSNSGRRKNKNSIINRIRKSRVKHITRKINDERNS
tara:strand:- start:215 stop:433 length:219 start_codon:yes stop_codon:yes gene_type:complete